MREALTRGVKVSWCTVREYVWSERRERGCCDIFAIPWYLWTELGNRTHCCYCKSVVNTPPRRKRSQDYCFSSFAFVNDAFVLSLIKKIKVCFALLYRDE